MSLTSLEFGLFFAAILLVFYSVPKRVQWMVLLVASYGFYAFASPLFLFFLVAATFISWAGAIWIGRNRTAFEAQRESAAAEVGNGEVKRRERALHRTNRWILVLTLVLTFGILVLMKYSNFLIEIANSMGGGFTPIQWLFLPLGISFYTFQSLGYSIDVYRGTVEAEQNPAKYALFVSFFPQITQGPIGRYSTLGPQLFSPKEFNEPLFKAGLLRILFGVFKKLVVANTAALYVDAAFGSVSTHSGLELAFAAVLYAVQLYADFSGYMDMALGLGLCLGIRLDENFQRPYSSRGIAEYWRRWHITLGAWLRDYLFYSLIRSAAFQSLAKTLKKSGWSRSQKVVPTVLALAVVWLTIGIWHGAAWNFVVHGLYHGGLIILGTVFEPLSTSTKRLLRIRDDNRYWNWFQVARTFVLVCLGYVVFRAESLASAWTILGRIFTMDVNRKAWGKLVGPTFPITDWTILIAGLLIMSAVTFVAARQSRIEAVLKWPLLVRWLGIGAILFLILLYGQVGTSAFLYAKF